MLHSLDRGLLGGRGGSSRAPPSPSASPPTSPPNPSNAPADPVRDAASYVSRRGRGGGGGRGGAWLFERRVPLRSPFPQRPLRETFLGSVEGDGVEAVAGAGAQGFAGGAVPRRESPPSSGDRRRRDRSARRSGSRSW